MYGRAAKGPAMPNFARQFRSASEQQQGRPSSSSFRSLDDDDHDDDDDLHLSSREISDHRHDGYAAADDGHPPLPPDVNVADAYDYQFAIAPSQGPHDPTQNVHKPPQRKHQRRQRQRQKQQRSEQELTRIPLTHMNSTDHILDNTFGDSLQSLSESLSNLDADVANEEELALRIIEEAHAARAYGDDGDCDGRRHRRQRVVLGCGSILAVIFIMSALVGKRHEANENKEDPLGLLSQSPDDTMSETVAWERVCSVHSLSNTHGRHQCADACRIYDCCAADDDTDGEASCADQKRDDCDRFWRLCPDVLDLPVDPSTPSTPQRTSNWEQQQLIQACGEANTNTAKFDQCQDLCEKHVCCLDMYGGGCVTLEEYQCHLYREPCSVLAVDLAQAIAQHVGREHEEKVEQGGGRYLR